MYFSDLNLKWGPHTIDRFDSMYNAKLRSFNSRKMTTYMLYYKAGATNTMYLEYYKRSKSFSVSKAFQYKPASSTRGVPCLFEQIGKCRYSFISRYIG